MDEDQPQHEREFLRPQPAPSAEEVRASVRFPLHLPVQVAAEGSVPIEAITEDISANGILLTSEYELPPGSNIEFSIRMPASVLGTKTDVMVQGSGRVVRTYKDKESEQNRVAAVIDDYTLEAVPGNESPERTQ